MRDKLRPESVQCARRWLGLAGSGVDWGGFSSAAVYYMLIIGLCSN